MKLFKKKPLKPFDRLDVKVGQIIKFVNGSHIKRPYYAEVVEVLNLQNLYFKTSIPDLHVLEIGPDNWEYHKKRMELVGDKSVFGHLILNQKGLVTHIKQ